MSRLVPGFGWATPETLRGKQQPDPRNVQTSPKKRSTVLKSRPSLSSIFNSRQRSMSPYQQMMNPEEVICEEGQHYPLYDAHNPHHNPALLQRSGSSLNMRRRASASPKKGSLKRSQTPYNSPQKTISRLLHGLTGSMRAAANYFHETENVALESETLVKTESKSSVRFKPKSTISNVPPALSSMSAPKPPTSSLLEIGISRTPFMSTTSLSQAALPDPFSDISDTKAGPQQRSIIRHSSSASTSSTSLSGGSPTNVQETRIRDTGAPLAKETGHKAQGSSPKQSYTGQIEGKFEGLNGIAFSASPSSSIEVSVKSDVTTNADPQNGHNSSDISGQKQSSLSFRSAQPFTESPNDVTAATTSVNTTFASPSSAKSSTNSETNTEPSMGPRKFWLDVKADRDRRYRATMSGASTDDDSDVGVLLSRSDETKKHTNAGEPSSITSRVQSIVADECVSPLDINRQTPSPAHIPLPKSEVFTRYFELEAMDTIGYIGRPTQQIENVDIFSTEWEAADTPLKDPSRAYEETSECDSAYSGSAELSSPKVLASSSEQCHDKPLLKRFLPQMDQKPLTLQDELAGRAFQKKHARFTRSSSTASDRVFSVDERDASWSRECSATSVYGSRPKKHGRTLSSISTPRASEVANALATVGIPPKSVQDIVKEIRQDGDSSDSESDELGDIL
ncbi:MAG: hypothetical protein Q9160_003321 [Pyrenula sp. 1 TL-2023]